MMLKQSPSRNPRAAGRRYKVKHVSQLCLMLAVSLWMLYQLRHCYFNKGSIIEGTGPVRIGSREDKARWEKVVGKLGRKGLPGGLSSSSEEDDDTGTEEAGRGDEFELVDDLMDETDEQEEVDDKEQQLSKR